MTQFKPLNDHHPLPKRTTQIMAIKKIIQITVQTKGLLKISVILAISVIKKNNQCNLKTPISYYITKVKNFQ